MQKSVVTTLFMSHFNCITSYHHIIYFFSLFFCTTIYAPARATYEQRKKKSDKKITHTTYTPSAQVQKRSRAPNFMLICIFFFLCCFCRCSCCHIYSLSSLAGKLIVDLFSVGFLFQLFSEKRK